MIPATSTVGLRKSILNLRSGDPRVKRRSMKKNSPHRRIKFLSPAQLDEAIAEVSAAAKAEDVHVALIGGCALQLYGSDRLTADLDFVADNLLGALPPGKELSFGGEQTRTSTGVPVDLIIREDRWAALYEATLETAQRIKGVKSLVARPEYLLAMKLAAARDKDFLDVKFLLAAGVIHPAKAQAIAEEFLGGIGAQDVESMLLEYGLIKKARWRR